MQPFTTIADYCDPAIFDQEQAVLFQKEWQFAGFGRDLLRDGDFIVAEVGGKSVVVQNFDGELRGFLNVCSHRFSAIRRECKGNGPLQCQYHGWVYDGSGIPSGIANIKEFAEITDVRRNELALERWEVERCGELIFVRRGTGSGPSLKEWLAEAWAVVEAIGSALGAQIDCNRMVIDANWKVALENTLENYHVKSVHPTTFARLAAQTTEFQFEGPHSGWQARIRSSMQQTLHKLVLQLGVESKFEGYFHQFVFPSLTLATTEGLTYSVQSFRPLTPHSTEFTSYVFAAAQNGSDDERKVLLEACGSAVDFNRAVFEEDRIICGQTQRGIQMADSRWTGELSGEERRVGEFQRAWKHAMSGIRAESPRMTSPASGG